MVKEVVFCLLREGFFLTSEAAQESCTEKQRIALNTTAGQWQLCKTFARKENQFLRFEVWSQAKKLDSAQGLLSFPNPLTMLGEFCRESRLTYGLQWIMHSLDSVLKV